MGGKRIEILGTGSFLPERVLTNFDLEKILNTNDEWIYKRTGIKERRIAEPNINASDLAKEASLRAMEMGRVSVEDLDLIIMTTMTPDTACPSGANWLEAKLGAEKTTRGNRFGQCIGLLLGGGCILGCKAKRLSDRLVETCQCHRRRIADYKISLLSSAIGAEKSSRV